MKYIGAETSINDLILPMTTDFHGAIDRLRPKSVLDIGCQDGFALQVLFQHYPFIETVEGWDRDTEQVVLKWIQKFDRVANPALKYANLYGRYVRAFEGCDGRPVLGTEAEFRAAVNLQFEKDVLEVQPSRTYDLVIASNLLNSMLPYEVDTVLKVINDCRAELGFVYIHHRSLAKYNAKQRLSFGLIEGLCQKRAEAWGLARYEWMNDIGDVHITYTNLLRV